MLSGLYIDDSEADLAAYGQLLNLLFDDWQDGKGIAFACVKPGSVKDHVDGIRKNPPDLIALDYRLNGEVQPDGENQYRAGTLAQTIREMMVESPGLDMPIILISTEEYIKALYGPDKTSHDLFDYKLLKGTLAGTTHIDVARQLYDLCEAYTQIKGVDKSGVASLFGLSNDEWSSVEPTRFGNELSAAGPLPHQIARFIKRQIIERPSMLLAAKDIAALLGIHKDDGADAMHKLTELGFGYEGILGRGWPRIWYHRVLPWLSEGIGGNLLDVSNVDRAAHVNAILDANYRTAQSPWTSATNVRSSFACVSCERPAERSFSVAAFESHVPSFGQRGRICFDCVAKGTYRNKGIQFDQLDVGVVEAIISGEIVRP